MRDGNPCVSLLFSKLSPEDQALYRLDLQSCKSKFDASMALLQSAETERYHKMKLENSEKSRQEQQEIWNLKEERLQQEADYWRNTCKIHQRRPALVLQEAQVMHGVQRVLFDCWKADVAALDARIAECEKDHKANEVAREAENEEMHQKYQRKELEERWDHADFVNAAFDPGYWLLKRNPPSPGCMI